MKKILSSLLLILISTTACNSAKNTNSVMDTKAQTVSQLSTTLSTNKVKFKIGESINVSFLAKNNTAKDFTFLPWGTPLENRITSDCFDVTFMNKNLSYRGIMVKRMAPTEKDNLTIKSGEEAIGQVLINESYDFSKKGTYSIRFNKSHLGLGNSNTVEITIE